MTRISILVALLLISCGPSVRDKALSTTFASLNTASSAFLAYDRAHQADLVAQAPDRAGAEAELANYRRRRAPVQDAFVAAYRGLTAALLLNDDVSLANVIQAAAIVAEELADLGVKVKP